METRNLPLRILYTINSSPQYILARSHSFIIATILPWDSDSSHYGGSVDTHGSLRLEPRCATTSLKTCLDTICRASPELVQDLSRDFSVYVLDPLESNSAPAPVHISDASPSSSSQDSHTGGFATDQPRGVAVGLGLMSWALLADETDSTAVAGTLITLPTGKEALEVIFALRETAAMQKSSLPTALRSWGLPPLSPSKLSRGHASKPHRESRHPPKRLTNVNGKLLSSRPPLPNQNAGRQGCSLFSSDTSSYPNTTGLSAVVLADSHSLPRDIPGSFSASTLATLASIRMRTQAAKPLKSRKAPAIPTQPSEADKMMLTKEIYIGPVKKKGRPAKGSILTTDSEPDSGSNVATSDSSVSGVNAVIDNANTTETRTLPASGQLANSTLGTNSIEPHTVFSDPGSGYTQCKTKTTKKGPSQDTSSSAAAPSYPKPLNSTSLLDVLVHLSASSTSTLTNAQNTALLSAMSTIDADQSHPHSTSSIMENPALVNALRGLILMVSSQAADSSLSNSSSQTAHHRSHSQDDEIIVLDKENVNPSAFRRPADRGTKQINSNLSTSSDGLIAPTQAPFPVSASPKRTFSVRSNDQPTAALVPLQNHATSASEKRRKRTLSDFMDEREPGRGGKSREREWAERRDAHRHAHSSRRNSSTDSSLRHYSRLNTLDSLQRRDRSGTNSYYRTGLEPFTSPPRQVDSSRTNVKDENTRLFATGTKSPHVTRASASSPVRPCSRAPKRKYVVPDWARTQTSTLPRLSEAAQRALEEAHERKREDRGVKRKTGCRVEKEKPKRTTHSTRPSCEVTESGTFALTHLPSVPQDEPQLPLPIAASEAWPVFSVTSETVLPIRTLTPELSLSASSSSTITIPFPSTPPRKRPGMIRSPHYCRDSLFTPNPKPWGNILAGSPLFSPHHSPHHSLASPPGARVKGPTLPTQAIVVGKEVDEWKSSSPYCEDGDEDEEDIEVALNKELASAFGELETSFSLSNTSTDLINKRHSTPRDEIRPPREQREDDASQCEPYSNHVKQHWAGLPPSSPPPPTSPFLTPHGIELESQTPSDDDDDDDVELPVATSDAEEYCSDSEVMGAHPNIPDLSSCTNDELAAYLSNNEFSLLFPTADHTSLLDNPVSSDMDVFDQFTNLNAQSDSSCGDKADMIVDTGFGNTFENGLADFDFTQFWETFKPFVQDHMSGNDSHGLSMVPQEVPNDVSQNGDLDHAKLAEDVQALFSGCLM